MPIPTLPDFRSPRFLADHALWIMGFYGDRAIDPSGGMYHFFLDDGTVYDRRTRHLVSATRFVVTHAIAHVLSGEERYRRGAAHALAFVRDAFADRERGGFAWTISWEDGRVQVTDPTRHMYGLAFVMLAAARAHGIGIAGADQLLEQTFDLAETRFFEPVAELYADEATPQWVVSGYRGQNANMHACEAAIAAFEATADQKYLQRAEQLAHAITVRQAAHADGGIWEHYRADWTPDWTTTASIAQTSSALGASSPDTSPSGRSCSVSSTFIYRGRGTCRARASCSIVLWTSPGTASTVDCTMDLRPTPRSATLTSTTGCRPSRSLPQPISPYAAATHVIGTGTSASGTIAGITSSTTATARGFVS